MDRSIVKVKFSIISLILILMNPGHAIAAKNDRELQITGGFFLARGDASTGTAQGEIAYGYFLTPKWQTGARLLGSYSLNDPIEDVWTGSLTGFINYYLWGDRPGKRLQPFFGAFLGLGYSDVDVTGTAGPIIGLKYYITEETFLVGQYRYEAYFKELEAGDETDDFDNGNHVLTMGLGFRW